MPMKLLVLIFQVVSSLSSNSCPLLIEITFQTSYYILQFHSFLMYLPPFSNYLHLSLSITFLSLFLILFFSGSFHSSFFIYIYIYLICFLSSLFFVALYSFSIIGLCPQFPCPIFCLPSLFLFL